MDRSLVAGVLGNARCLPRAKDLRTCRRIPSLLCRAPSSTGGPRVRIHLPPAASPLRTLIWDAASAEDELLTVRAFGLDPETPIAGRVRRIGALRDDSNDNSQALA
jgi:hypothetical protein